MWEKGARIYGTSGVPNNFPQIWQKTLKTTKNKEINVLNLK